MRIPSQSRSIRGVRRRGASTLEVVITIGVGFPMAVILYLLGCNAMAGYYNLILTLVCWPFM